MTEDNLLIYYPVPAGSKVLATIDTGFDEPFESQQWANANLMRAAPDLLAAANAVLRDFMPMFPDSRAVDDCLVQLAAAVAKAEA